MQSDMSYCKCCNTSTSLMKQKTDTIFNKSMKPPPSSSSSVLRKVFLSPYLFTLLPLIFFVFILYGENISGSIGQQFDPCLRQSVPKPGELTQNHSQANQGFILGLEKQSRRVKLPFSIGETEQGCDVFSGRWVRDEPTRPLYEESDCPYIKPQLTCQEHGRPEKEYQFWRWQPHGCSLPSFNATLMLEALRGKRMMFVGDSLNQGQYVSMVCLLHSIIPENSKSMETNGSLTVFTAKDYNATIEFYWAPLLLESNSDNAVDHRITDRVIKNDSIMTHGQYWTGVDIMVFSTYIWWMKGTQMKILRGSFNDEVLDIVELKVEDAYRMAMKSMLGWVKEKMDPKKTRVFFTSMSPFHSKRIEWGGKLEGNCYNETTPIEDPTYWGHELRKSIMQVIGDEFSKSKVPITFLNITQLSSYRKDAHTSIYKKRWSPLTPEQLANPVSYADCVHWCVPGLQDTWNELLFTKLFYP